MCRLFGMTVGEQERTVANTHPFCQHGRLFAHNGVIDAIGELERRLGDERALVDGVGHLAGDSVERSRKLPRDRAIPRVPGAGEADLLHLFLTDLEDRRGLACGREVPLVEPSPTRFGVTKKKS